MKNTEIDMDEQKVSHILVECPELLPSVRLGVLDPLGRLERLGECRVRYVPTSKIKTKDLVWCDIFVTVRGCESMTVEIARLLKKANRFIVYYLDDDLLNLPEYAISSEFYQRESIRNNLKQLIGMSNAFWVSNPLIAQKYKKYGTGRCFTLDVIADVEEMNEPEYKNKEKVKFLYAGSTDHSPMVNEILVPAIRRILQEYKKGVEFTFIGVKVDLKNEEQVKIIPFMKNYDEYKRKVKSGNYDVGLAVVKTEEFFQCKYYNKFIEYASMGIMGIYTNALPYTYIVHNGENGLLANNSADEWYYAMKRAISNKTERIACTKKAREQLKNKFNQKVILENLKSNMPEVLEYKVEGDKSQIHLRALEWIYLRQRLSDYWKNDKVHFVSNVIGAVMRKTKERILEK